MALVTSVQTQLEVTKYITDFREHCICCCFKITSRWTQVVNGLQKSLPSRKWREPITAPCVRRTRLTLAGVVRGLECYNVTIGTGSSRIKVLECYIVSLAWETRFRCNATNETVTLYYSSWENAGLHRRSTSVRQHWGFITQIYVRTQGFVGIFSVGKFVTARDNIDLRSVSPTCLYILQTGFQEHFFSTSFRWFPQPQRSFRGR